MEGTAEKVIDKAARTPLRCGRAHPDEQLAWDDVENVFDRHECHPGSKQTAAHDELVGSIVEAAISHPFDHSETAAPRLDAEAFAAAQPVIAVECRSPGEPELAIHGSLPDGVAGPAQSRSRSAMLDP